MACEWREVSLGDLIDIKHGFAFKGHFIHDDPSRNVLLTPGNFSIGGGFKGDKLKYYHGPVPDEFVLREGDLLVTMTDLSKKSDTLGFPALIPICENGMRYLHNQRLGKILILEPTETNVRYISYVMCGAQYRHEVLASATGTTVKHTSPDRIKQFRFLCAPPSEQRSIANILGTIEDKIDLNRRMNETLEAMVRALFRSWFVDFDPIRAKAEGRDPDLPQSLADLFPARLVDSEFGEMPEGWEAGTVADWSSLNTETWTKGERPAEIRYLDLSNTKRGRIEAITPYAAAKAPSRAQRVLRPGDTIVGTVRPGNGSYALVSELGLTGSTGFAVLRPKAAEFTEFVYLATTSADSIDALAHLADGAAYPAVRPDVVAATPIVRPDHKVLARFSSSAGALLGRIAHSEKESRTLASVRDLLLPKLISGEIRLRDAEKTVEAVA